MLRKILGVVALLALPALLVAQWPSTPPAAAKAAVTHGIAMQVLGEVASPVEEMDGQNNQAGVDEADDQNNDAQNDDGQFDQDGVDEPDGLNNDGDVGEQAGQAGENEDDDSPPAPPSGASQLSRIGRHKP
jgi:hypothetical protein